MTRVLVTGAGGFVGSHVLAALAEQGAEPVALARGTDYHDAAAAEAVLRATVPAALVHCAWRLAAGSAYLSDPANVEDVEASLRLFRLAERHGCRRMVGLGTCLEYEPRDGAAPEDAPLRPQTLYGAAKAALFTAAEAWASEVGVSFAWARLYFPFGPREAPQRLVPTVVRSLLRGERVATTEGSQRRSFLYVEDVADAVAAIALSDARGPFNIGSAEAIPVRELVERLGAAVGRRDLLDIGALERRDGDPEILWGDTTRVRSVVGWRPRRSLDEAVERTVAWWRANG